MTKRGLAWAAWLFAAAALWLFENNAATLALLTASALIPPLSIASARRARKRVRLTLTAPDAGAKGNAPRATLSAEGRGVFCRVAGAASCENRLTGERAETAFSFPPRLPRSAALTFAVGAGYCGVLRLRAEAWTEDLFGLWRSEPIPCGEEYATVAPELFPPRVTLVEETTLIAEGERYSRTRPGNDPSETFAVRAYVPGDPIRQIHWKLSQKTDELMLRELGLPVVDRTLLIFRNERAADENVPPERADAMAKVFLSVSRALANDGLVHTAAFLENGRYLLAEVRGEENFYAMEERFLALAWEPDGGALARLLAETPYVHVVIVSTKTPPDAERFCRGNRVTLLSASPGASVPGVHTVPFTAAGYREELRFIEL